MIVVVLICGAVATYGAVYTWRASEVALRYDMQAQAYICLGLLLLFLLALLGSVYIVWMEISYSI